MSTRDGGPPWDAIRYASIDYVLATGRWNKTITKAWSTPETQTDSDHFLLRASFRCKLAAQNKKTEKRERYEKPNQLQRDKYNEEINKRKPETANELIEAIAHSSKQHLTPRDPAIREPYITEESWALAKKKQEARGKQQPARRIGTQKTS